MISERKCIFTKLASPVFYQLNKGSNNRQQVETPSQKVIRFPKNVAMLINEHGTKSGQQSLRFEDVALRFPQLSLPDKGDGKMNVSRSPATQVDSCPLYSQDWSN